MAALRGLTVTGSLVGRVALVTGGSRGIGAGIARRLAHAGAAVALSYREQREQAEGVAEKIHADGGAALALPLEVEARASVRAALGRIRDQLGAVDILVNNAAIGQSKPFLEIDEADWDRMLAVNLRGPFVCAQEVLPEMMERRWGRLVNIASIGGQWGGVHQVHYAAAKAGLINFTRSLARLYSDRGVTSNAVAPGLVPTEMTESELSSEAGQQALQSIPSGRTGTVEEVADAVAYLASDAAAYITGQTVNVNGGMYFG